MLTLAIVNRVPNKSVSFADMSSWLAANDFYLWKDKKRVGEGKTMLLREHPGKRVSNKGFSEAREQCKWWKKSSSRERRPLLALTPKNGKSFVTTSESSKTKSAIGLSKKRS